jgi:hypothetical protein
MSQAQGSEDQTSQSEDSLAREPLLVHLTEKDSPTNAAAITSSSSDSSASISDSLTQPIPDGWSSRIRSGSSPAQVEGRTESTDQDGTWPPSSEVWKTSGMGGPTGWWTHNISDRPSDASESSWLDILEETPDPLGRCWVTPEIAKRLVPRIASGGKRVDPRLLSSLLAAQKDH